MTLKSLGEEAVSPVDKANLFNRYFHSVFNQGVFPPASPDNANNDNPHFNSIQISTSGVRDVLLGPDVTKAVGLDSLSPRVLRECADIHNFINPVNVYRDLGFMVTSDLTWKVHVDSVAKKASRSLGYIKRTCGFKAPVQAKKLLQLYLTMVRSKLEVGVLVWSSHRKENLMKIEGVQRSATRFILRSDIGYKYRLSACGLIPLSLRQEMLDLSFLFKCRQGFYSLDLCDFCSEYCPIRRTRRA
ncbi:hypothetical protein P5673_023150, partial [Acropora cervicornis]